MQRSEQRRRAEEFRSFHLSAPILVLPNAWDVASARVLAAIPGCRAIATTSAGVAEALGYTDQEGTPREAMLEAVARIARAVDLPVTADLEAGYGDPVATAEGAVEAGAVGLNFEDATYRDDDPLQATAVQAERISSIRAAGESAGVPLVINARTDVFLAQVGGPEGRVELATERGRAYLEAGADCVFVPAVRDAETIGALVRAMGGPVSVLAGRGTPPVAELERLGVARVSVGSSAYRTTLAFLDRLGREVLGDGLFDGLP